MQIFRALNLQSHLVGITTEVRKVLSGPGDIEGFFPLSLALSACPSFFVYLHLLLSPSLPLFLTRYSGHRGHDGRYYLLDFARALPPEYPQKGTREIYFHLLRRELVVIYQCPLNPDAFSGWSKADPDFHRYNTRVKEATFFLYEKLVPETAKKLDATPFPLEYLRNHKGFLSFSFRSFIFLSPPPRSPHLPPPTLTRP